MFAIGDGAAIAQGDEGLLGHPVEWNRMGRTCVASDRHEQRLGDSYQSVDSIYLSRQEALHWQRWWGVFQPY